MSPRAIGAISSQTWRMSCRWRKLAGQREQIEPCRVPIVAPPNRSEAHLQFLQMALPDQAEKLFDQSGFPAGIGWSIIDPFGSISPDAYALEIVGSAFLPLYRDGDLLIVSPATPSRLGDRVLVQDGAGGISARVLGLRTARTVEFYPLDPTRHEIIKVAAGDIRWISRILWARQ